MHTTSPALERLATLLDSPDGVRILRWLARASTEARGRRSGQQSDVAPVVSDGARSQQPIGIWHPQRDGDDTVYLRTSVQSAGLWADVPVLRRSHEGKCVVLLGESVARGFYYDPHFNPACALERMLDSGGGPGRVDVVDLARVDCTPELLLQLAWTSLQLRPDAVVLFAGNNWSPFARLGWSELQDIADTMRGGEGHSAVAEYTGRRLGQEALEWVRLFVRLMQANGVPVVIVIPEFNLLDWRSDCADAVAFIDRESRAQWREAHRRAERALDMKDWKRVEAAAKEMISLDHGWTSTALELLGRAETASGRSRDARSVLEQARDVTLASPGFDTPRCFAVVQDALRRAATSNVRVVDLPHRFEDHSGGALPDRMLLLDYCHLSVDGIRIAMAAVAEQLLDLLYTASVDSRQLMQRIPEPSAGVQAEAQFLAAVHNSHWRQPENIVRFHCERALELSASVADTMISFVEGYARDVPRLFSRSFNDILFAGHSAASNVLQGFVHSDLPLVRNPTLIDVLVETLRLYDSDVDERVRRLLGARAPSTSSIDLLQTLHAQVTYSDRDQLWSSAYGCHLARTPSSEFWLPSRGDEPVRFQLTYRTRASTGDLCVAVNGSVVHLPASNAWRTERFGVACRILRPGLNRIKVTWPEPVWCAADEWDSIASQLELGSVPPLTPLYGELHAFEAQFTPDR